MTRETSRRRLGARSGARLIRRNPREGSSLDDFLREQGLFDEVRTKAIKETIVWQIAHAMEKLDLTKTELADRMGTSRAALDRLLDPKNESVTLGTLLRAGDALGLSVRVTFGETERESQRRRSVRSRSERR